MITSKLKNVMLSAYQISLTKITLNQAIDVPDFETSIDSDVLLIQFEVPTGVTEIKKIELFEGDNLLTTRELYVPVLNDTRFKFKVEVSD